MDPNQQPGQTPQQPAPQPPSTYTAPTPVGYDPNYLDTIAPPAPRAKFLSGTFGKMFYVLMGLFVLGVSLIIAFSGKDETADLQQVAVRLENYAKTAKTVQKNLKSKNLKNINSKYESWLLGNQTSAEDLLKTGGVSKTEYGKEMVKKENAKTSDLDEKFEDARLAGRLHTIYALTMAVVR